MEKQRKHRTEMSTREIAYAESLVHSIVNPTPTPHALQKLRKGGMSEVGVLAAMAQGDLIEVNDKGRCVMRLHEGPHSGTVVVVDVQHNVLVTTWANSPDDNHSTLKKSGYGWEINVVDYLSSLNR